MKLDLVPYTDPLLKTPAILFDFLNPPFNASEFAKNLADTMLANNGIGLAANQVGSPYAVFAINTNPVIVAYNPYLVGHGEEVDEREEACLTYPGLIVKVPRYGSIKVRYTQPDGEVITAKFAGLTARTIQHEMEHLGGGNFTRHLSRLELERALKKAKKHYKRDYAMGPFLAA